MANRPPVTFNYVEPSPADLNAILTHSPSSFDTTIEGASFWYAKNGEHILRVLPWSDHKHWALGSAVTPPAIWEHQRVGVRNGSYLCLNKMKSQRCPICEEVEAMRQRDPVKAKQIAAKPRYYLYILNRRGPNPAEPRVWNIWDRLHDSITGGTKALSGAVIPVTHPNEGFDLGVVKTGQLMIANYECHFDREPSPILRDPAQQAQLLQWLAEHPLDSLLRFKSTAYLEEIMGGTAVEPDAELDSEPEPVEEAPRRPARAAVVEDSPLPNGDKDEDDERDEEDPEDEELDEEEADEQVAPPPAPRDPELRARRREPEPARREPEAPRRRPSNGNPERDGPPLRSVPTGRDRAPERNSRYRDRD